VNRFELINRLRDVESEYRVALHSVARMRAQAALSAGAPALAGLSSRHVRLCLEHMESTYIVRLFAEFEAALRVYWRPPGKRPRSSPKPVRALMDRTASQRHIHGDCLRRAHQVRECRNTLVHETPSGAKITLEACRSHLCTFLSYLPVNW
jgi:hypothetical protein